MTTISLISGDPVVDCGCGCPEGFPIYCCDIDLPSSLTAYMTSFCGANYASFTEADKTFNLEYNAATVTELTTAGVTFVEFAWEATNSITIDSNLYTWRFILYSRTTSPCLTAIIGFNTSGPGNPCITYGANTAGDPSFSGLLTINACYPLNISALLVAKSFEGLCGPCEFGGPQIEFTISA